MEIAVRHGRVDPSVRDVGPVAIAQGADALSLFGRQDDVFEVMVDQDRKGGVVAGGFRQPEGLGLPVEPVLEVLDAPLHLGDAVRFVAKGQDGVVITLGDGVAVAAILLGALFVRLQDFLIGPDVVFLHPGKERGAEIEADGLVIVDDSLDPAALQVEYPGECVGAVTLVINAVVPIGERLGAGLVVNDTRPGVFPGGW